MEKSKLEIIRKKLLDADRKKMFGIIMKSTVESELEKILRLRQKPTKIQK